MTTEPSFDRRLSTLGVDYAHGGMGKPRGFPSLPRSILATKGP